MGDEREITKRFWVSFLLPRRRFELVERKRGIPIDTWYMGCSIRGEHYRAVIDAISEEMVWRQLGVLFGAVHKHDIIERAPNWEPPLARPFIGSPLRTVLPDKPNRYVKMKERKTTE